MTLSILAIDKTKEKILKIVLEYLILTLFFSLFGAIYEVFSHGVYSYRMIYAFGYPLILGLVPVLIMHFSRIKKLPGTLSGQLYRCGIYTLTIGSVVKGVLEIYGTTSRLSDLYTPAGFLLILAGFLLFLIGNLLAKNK